MSLLCVPSVCVLPFKMSMIAMILLHDFFLFWCLWLLCSFYLYFLYYVDVSVFLLPVFCTSYIDVLCSFCLCSSRITTMFLCSFFLCSAFNNVNGFFVLSACVLPVSWLRFCVLIFRVPSDIWLYFCLYDVYVSVFLLHVFCPYYVYVSVFLLSKFWPFYFTSIVCIISLFLDYISPLCTTLFCTCLHSHCHLLFCSGCFLIFVPPVSTIYFLSKGLPER